MHQVFVGREQEPAWIRDVLMWVAARIVGYDMGLVTLGRAATRRAAWLTGGQVEGRARRSAR